MEISRTVANSSPPSEWVLISHGLLMSLLYYPGSNNSIQWFTESCFENLMRIAYLWPWAHKPFYSCSVNPFRFMAHQVVLQQASYNCMLSYVSNINLRNHDLMSVSSRKGCCEVKRPFQLRLKCSWGFTCMWTKSGKLSVMKSSLQYHKIYWFASGKPQTP